jgi:hypothetical protein
VDCATGDAGHDGPDSTTGGAAHGFRDGDAWLDLSFFDGDYAQRTHDAVCWRDDVLFLPLLRPSFFSDL